MEQKPMQDTTKNNLSQPVARTPNEQPLVNVDEFLRISDPATQQVFVEQRG